MDDSCEAKRFNIHLSMKFEVIINIMIFFTENQLDKHHMKKYNNNIIIHIK
jgi:hypothetical protein